MNRIGFQIMADKCDDKVMEIYGMCEEMGKYGTQNKDAV